MLVLCGFAISNYYNKVKLALLEKGVEFTEELVPSGKKSDAVLQASPLGKVPFIRTEHGALCESQAIMDYIESRYPNPPLVPADAWGAAKVRELITFIDLHIELVVRELYGKAFFGGEISEGNAERVRKLRFFQAGQYISIDYGRQDVLVFSVGGVASASHSLTRDANEWSTRPSVNPQISMAKPPVTAEEPLLAEIKAFLQSVRDRSRPVVRLEDGRKALELGLAILEEIRRHAGRIGMGRS